MRWLSQGQARKGLVPLPSWRNWIAHQTSNLGVAGSIPVEGKKSKLQSSDFKILNFANFHFFEGPLQAKISRWEAVQGGYLAHFIDF